MVAGGLDLAQIVQHQLLILDMGDRQGGEPDDRVHRCADVMGHVIEESGLGDIGLLRFSQCLSQDLLLLLLLAHHLIDVPETGQDNAVLPMTATLHLDIGKLEVMHLTVDRHPIAPGILHIRLQLFLDPV